MLCSVSGATAGTPPLDLVREQPIVPARAAAGAELDSALLRVAAAPTPARALTVARATGLGVEDGLVRVDVETRSVEPVAEAVERAGGEVEGTYGSLVQALVPPDRLAPLAARTDVVGIDRPSTFQPASVTGEGIALLGADRAQSAGFDGAGTSIAVFDSTFAGYTARQASGDLPANLMTRGFCSSGLTAGNGHGTAVAEVVHELAPAAELHLVCINTLVDLGRAKDYAIDMGIDVINMSGGFFNAGDGHGTGTGIFAELPDGIAKAARDAGIVWVNATGNEALTHWSGTLADPDEDGLHDFAAGDEGNTFLAGAGQTLCAYARWRAWAPSGPYSDFDLYVTNAATGAVVAVGETDQRLFDPTEDACFTNSGPSQSFSAVLVHRAGDPSPLIDLFVPGAAGLEYAEPRGSLIEPSASTSVLSVGAVCSWTGALEPYSSRGREAAPVKPDLLAPDAVSTASSGASSGCASGFTGTSAATPHVGGLVALLRDQHPGSTAGQLEALARAWSRDVGRPGADPDTGFGVARLVTTAPVIGGSTAFPVGTQARGIARLTSAVPGTYRWQYGLTTTYASMTQPVAFASSPTGVDIGDAIPFVSAGTFHARIVATNAYGTTFGPDEVFVAPVGPPSVATMPPDSVTAVGAQLVAYGAANGSTTRVDFELGTTTSYGTIVAGPSIGLGSGVRVAASTPPLRPSTTYHVRAVATNSLGQVTHGRDVEFTTPPDVSVVPGAVAIAGTAAVGSTLSATTGAWATMSPHAAPPSLGYQWLRCRAAGSFCAPVPGAVGSTYAVQPGDAGRSLRVAVTGTVPWNAGSATSAPTGPVSFATGGGPVVASPAGSGGGSGGAADVEVTLSASAATLRPNGIVEVRVTVFNKDAVVGATGLTATLTLPADARLLGPPAFDRGSGCTGTRTLVCYLDYLPGRATTVLRFSIDVGAAGEKTVGAALTLNVWDPDTANNAVSLTLKVVPPATVVTQSVAPAAVRTLTGRPGADVLRGTAGRDVILGRGGDDRLYGGKGRDRLEGGAGNDRIYAQDGVRDVVRCGSGRDRVSTDRIDSVAGDCELVTRST